MFGTDLHDDGRESAWATASKHTWPALLAQHLGFEYQCCARPGAGNLQIWENIVNQIASEEPAVYIVGWTWIDRFDYIRDDAPHWWGGRRWKTIMPIDTDTTAQTYYRELHSEQLDKMKSLIYVQSALQLLLEGGLAFVMTSMDDLLLDQRWNVSPGMMVIQDKIRPYLSSFNGENFLNHSRRRGHTISASMHPLESAHRDAADLVIENFHSYIKGKTSYLQKNAP